MARNYTVHTRILAPVADVFDAIVSRDKLCNYFTSLHGFNSFFSFLCP